MFCNIAACGRAIPPSKIFSPLASLAHKHSTIYILQQGVWGILG